MSFARLSFLRSLGLGRFDAIADLVAPNRCAACGGGEAILCAVCRAFLVRAQPPLCARCGAPTAWPVERCVECAGRRLPFTTARAGVLYDERAKRLVRAWKEGGLTGLTDILADVVADAVARPDAQAVVFVPADGDRTRWRGLAAPEALAFRLAAAWALPFVPLLVRTRRPRRQRGLDRTARRANVRGAFAVLGRSPAAVVLVDDVYTTGATVSAAAAALRRARAREIHVVTFARAVRR